MKTTPIRLEPVPKKACTAFLALLKKTRVSRLMLGVSGGPDSVFLLQVALSCRSALHTLHIAHLNHRLRGEASEHDAAFVKKLAQSHRLPVHIEAVAKAKAHSLASSGIEAAGRKARQNFFADLLIEHNLDAVALAHNLDDQAETVLLHLTRGAGSAGLSGMREDTSIILPDNKSLRILRPLLAVTKSEVLEYLNANQIAYCTDQTNHSLKFSRNRIRHKVLPELEKINPQVKQALARTALLFQQQNDQNDAVSDKLLQQVVMHQSGNLVEISLSQLNKIGTGEQSSLIETLLRNFLQKPDNLAWQHVDQVVTLVAGSVSGKSVSLPEGASALRTAKTLQLHRTLPQETPPAAITLNLPGQSRWGKWLITTKTTTVPPAQLKTTKSGNKVTLHLDATKLTPKSHPLNVRSWQAGDRIKPLGLKQHRKLQDLFGDRKVPRHTRNSVPVIEKSDGTILCAGALTLHNDYKITPETKHFLEISFSKELPDGQA